MKKYIISIYAVSIVIILLLNGIATRTLNGLSWSKPDHGTAAIARVIDVVTAPVQVVVFGVHYFNQIIEEPARRRYEEERAAFHEKVDNLQLKIADDPMIVVNDDYLSKGRDSVEYRALLNYDNYAKILTKFPDEFYYYLYENASGPGLMTTEMFEWLIGNHEIPESLIIDIYNEHVLSVNSKSRHTSIILANRSLPLEFVERTLSHNDAEVRRTAAIVIEHWRQ